MKFLSLLKYVRGLTRGETYDVPMVILGIFSELRRLRKRIKKLEEKQNG